MLAEKLRGREKTRDCSRVCFLCAPGVCPTIDVHSARKGGAKVQNQRLLNWKRRRAPAWPYFLRSTSRLSRVRTPISRKRASSVGS